MSNPEAKFYNALNLLKSGNYQTLRKIKDQYQSWRAGWEICQKDNPKIDPETEWQKLEKTGVRLALLGDQEYPALLKEIPQPPFGLYVIGEWLPNNDEPTLAIVGTRKATAGGLELARKWANELARAGLKIISGLALGIDAAAHQGVVDISGQTTCGEQGRTTCGEQGRTTCGEQGRTMAVLGGGLDNFYPRQNEQLAKKIIASKGSIVSEYPLGMPALAHQFLERNRIVSGLSQGVLIIEAPKESGALVTAHHALDQNREVFVIPGPVNHPNYFGSHQLIRAGAQLVTKPEEILETLNLAAPQKILSQIAPEIPEEKMIFEIIKNAGQPIDIDKIVESSSLKISIVNQILTKLLIKGIIKEEGGKYHL